MISLKIRLRLGKIVLYIGKEDEETSYIMYWTMGRLMYKVVVAWKFHLALFY